MCFGFFISARRCAKMVRRHEKLYYTGVFSMVIRPEWLERLHALAGGKRKRAGYIRDVIDLLYTDKVVRDLVNRKLEVNNER